MFYHLIKVIKELNTFNLNKKTLAGLRSFFINAVFSHLYFSLNSIWSVDVANSVHSETSSFKPSIFV